jgi:riboflavin biosynthesis pyrimidine reductase
MVEGGAPRNFEWLRLRLVAEGQIYVAPLVFGGATAPTLAAGAGLPRDAAIQLYRTNVELWDDGGLVLTYTVV